MRKEGKVLANRRAAILIRSGFFFELTPYGAPVCPCAFQAVPDYGSRFILFLVLFYFFGFLFNFVDFLAFCRVFVGFCLTTPCFSPAFPALPLRAPMRFPAGGSSNPIFPNSINDCGKIIAAGRNTGSPGKISARIITHWYNLWPRLRMKADRPATRARIGDQDASCEYGRTSYVSRERATHGCHTFNLYR